jgi:hypothetical protein
MIDLHSKDSVPRNMVNKCVTEAARRGRRRYVGEWKLPGETPTLHIAEPHLGEYGKHGAYMRLFSSESLPSDGDITFGPFTPGTYDLKILDANGKILWEETRTIH